MILPIANIQKRHNCFNTNKLFIVLTIFVSLFVICNDSFAQGRRDIDKFRTSFYNPFDTSRIKGKDSLTLAIEDSLRKVPVDSTARIKYFKYIRNYVFGVKIIEKTHPLILDNSSLIKSELKFDSLNNVVINQTFEGEDIKAPLVVPIEKYLKVLSRANERSVFKTLFNEKFKGVTVDDISRLFQKFTDITIPLPFKTETIFGPPTANLRINGAIDITASYQNIQSEQSVLTLYSNSQNNINFKQEVQVTAKGTIGDKLTVEADWNTQRVFDFENQLKIKYTGYADEVIQKIEAGNVSLDTKSSLIQSTQALFGIKGDFKLGPLNLSAVISQKKSKQETKDYVGGAQEQSFQLNVWDYSESHYFLDTIYKYSFLAAYNDSTGIISQDILNKKIKTDLPSFQVWVQCDNTVSLKKKAIAWVWLKEKPIGGYDTTYKRTDQLPDTCFYGFFRELNPTEYSVEPVAGFISLKINVPENYAVGVTYETYENKKFGNGKYDVTGDEMMILNMIKCANQSPDATPRAWELKMKNIYRLPISKVIQDGFKLDAVYNNNNVLQTNIPEYTISLSTMLGIDKYSGTVRRYAPDGLFDYLPARTINTETGDIIFPTLRPFLDDIKKYVSDTSYKYAEIYLNRKTVAQTSINATRYYIKGTAKGEAGISNTINLGFNVVQGSVKLTLGSLVLKENEDYSVDYNTGIVVIRNATALASKDLKISYETNDLFSLASKTLFGVRGDYKVSDKTGFGFTFLNLRQETLNDKVRIGEEPTNNSMVGVDFTTEAKPKFLTKLVNLLPGYNTKEESSVSFKSELAYILPDPNTMKSRIPQDNNEAIAYVDDMEGAKKIVSLGINYSYWTMSSLPLDTLETKKNNSARSRLRWYNVANGVSVKDVYPLRDVQPGQDRITPLVVNYDPTSRGTYNPNVKGWDTTTTPSNVFKNWNGMMRYLNTTSTDLLNENINFIEFNMQISNSNGANLSNAKMIIDLGYISEDAIPNQKLDTEDSLNNGILQTEFDIGLDFKTDFQELAYINQLNQTNYSIDTFPNRDPMLDNNDSTGAINYGLINGTQNNRLFEGGNRPDSEDLNRNGTMDSYNQYFEYIISLDTTNNRRISGRGAPGTGWFQYRVPLSEFTKNIGNANLNHIEYARVWITGIDKAITMQIVDFNLVGNQWYKPNKNDDSYNINVVSIEENSQIYMSPVPGDVLRQTIRNTSGVNTKSNEQSLSLEVINLTNGQGKIAIKDYTTQALDLFNYKTLKLFVNGDPSFNYTNENTYDATMIVRFGTDSLNFYEYRAPVHPDFRPGQPWNQYNEVTINFSDLTGLKFKRDSVNQVIDAKVPNGPPGAYYRIKGAPALNIIRQIVVGVEKNRSGPNATLTGSVWFNEIRVLKVNDDNGYAYNVNTSVKLADLANISVNVSKVDPNFHSIDTRQGSRNTGQTWDFSASLNVHKIINNALANIISDEWKDFLTLPISIRHSENLTNPKYYPGTDIDLEDAAEEKYKQVLAKTNDENQAALARDNLKKEAQTLVIRNDFAISGMAFKFPGNNYFVKKIVNAFSVNFNATFGSQRDITYESKTDFSYTGSLNFNTDFGLAEKFNLKLGKLLNLGEQYKNAKVYLFLPFLPLAPMYTSNFTATTDFSRSRNESKQRAYTFEDPTGRMFRANRGFGFNWKFIEDWIIDLTGNYSVKIGSELTQIETDSLNRQRSNGEIFGDIFFKDAFVNFGKDMDYTQSTAINPKLNIPYLNKFVDITTNYSVTYGWLNPSTTSNIGYNVGFSNTWNLQTNFRLSDIINIFKGGEGMPQKYRGFSSAGKDTTKEGEKTNITDLLKIFGTFIPENISMIFNQTNQVTNPGVEGRPGFGNFWMLPTTKENFGPSRMYQLGLSMYPGKRTPNLANITDAYNQTNNITFSATINPIIPQSIRMNLTFKRLWGFNNTTTFNSNESGILGDPINKAISKNYGYSMFFAGIVDEKFQYESVSDPNENIKSLSSTFKSKIGSFPFPNWTITISGLEKFPLFSEFASTVSIENGFTSEYSEASSVDATNTEVISRQSVTQSFAPLLGLNITFKQLLGGSLTASFRLNKSTTNSLVPSSSLIQVTSTNDWSLNANYAKAGFEIPLFGLALKNDISFALTVSKNTNNPIDWKFDIGNNAPTKIQGNGTAVTTINPSVQYSLSSRVQMQLFYKYIKTEPIDNVSTIPRTSNEGGLNIKISIQ